MIPEEWREEWDELSQDENGWEKEGWEKFEGCRTGGGISNISFENPSGGE